MAWCFLLVNLLVILLASRLRFAGRGLEYASPICLSPQAWWWVIGACAALAAIAAAVGRRRLRDRRARRALLELAVVFPLFFAFEWGMLPPLHRRWFDWAIMGGFVLHAETFDTDCSLDLELASFREKALPELIARAFPQKKSTEEHG